MSGRPLSPPPPADASTSTPAFFAEDDDEDDGGGGGGSDQYSHGHRRDSSLSSVSTTSLILEHLSERAEASRAASRAASSSPQPRRAGALEKKGARGGEGDDGEGDRDGRDGDDCDLETGPFLGGGQPAHATTDADDDDDDENGDSQDGRGGSHDGGLRRTRYTKMDPGLRRTAIVLLVVMVTAWVGGLAVYLAQRSGRAASFVGTGTGGGGAAGLRKITRDQLAEGFFSPKRASIQWVAGPAGEDGLLLETSRAAGSAYLTVKDVRSLDAKQAASSSASSGLWATRTLVQRDTFVYGGKTYTIGSATASGSMAKVLLAVNSQSNWRHSSTAAYFVLDVATQAVEPLVPGEPDARVQLAQWSPTSDAVAFTRDNNVYVRTVASTGDAAAAAAAAAAAVRQVTTDGGEELFYGVPDWVYEEEVFAGASATWWSPDGQYLAFLRTNETGVPSYPVQYFIERPSGTTPAAGAEHYPEVRNIKYPKAGAHNPVVDLQFYDVAAQEVFSVAVAGDFADDDRLITTVLWAGARKVVVKETNRISDVMRVVVVDVGARAGQAVRTVDVGALDGGWFEISQRTRYVPADPARQRPADGYIDTVVYNNGDHLAYFSPPENATPVMLTQGPGWEVVDAPAAVDLARNLVYFVATLAGATQRHVYRVRLADGGGLAPVTGGGVDGGAEAELAFYGASFSAGAGYALLDYRGPGVPWQKVVGLEDGAATPAFEHVLEDNAALAERVRTHALPELVYGTLEVGGGEDGGPAATVNYVERRPPDFDAGRQYPVLFQQYSGPGSQEVKHEFKVDFQSYVAASLGYVVVTVDPRGTGFLGRRSRVAVRGHLGVLEAQDHIAAARHWAARPYVDGARLAIWGWSYGGFTTLKTLETDAGRTFRYGMAVAPVTDWRFYDSIYTERYMDTPQRNGGGYDASAVQNASALAQNVRFLLMHGVADDNVHLQNSLALLDRLDLAGVSNYDVHVFPDSDHSIYFHNGNRIVYDKLENWLINAFNGEWLKVDNAKPHGKRARQWP